MHEFTVEHHGGFVLALWAAAEDILNNSLNSLYLNDTVFNMCNDSKEHDEVYLVE